MTHSALQSIDIMPNTVVIIEDQRMFRELLETLIHSIPDMQVVGKADSARQGLELFTKHNPSLGLIDLGLPDASGVELAKQIKAAFPQTPLLAVTSLMDPVTTTRVYESGFSGYVEKDQSPEILLEAIETVVEGGHYFTQLVRENRKKILSDADALNKTLSQREQEIIGWVSRKLTSKEIANKMSLSTRTIENHRYRIIKKLSLKNTQALVQFGQQAGLDKFM